VNSEYEFQGSTVAVSTWLVCVLASPTEVQFMDFKSWLGSGCPATTPAMEVVVANVPVYNCTPVTVSGAFFGQGTSLYAKVDCTNTYGNNAALGQFASVPGSVSGLGLLIAALTVMLQQLF